MKTRYIFLISYLCDNNFSKMARLELIKELRLRRKEIYAELQGQFPDLMEELAAIDKIIDRSKNLYVADSTSNNKVLTGTPKGNMSWEDYVLLMLREIGGVGKTMDVAKAIVNANDNITLKRAKEACSDKLSRHLSAKRVRATKGTSKKDGYVYEAV